MLGGLATNPPGVDWLARVSTLGRMLAWTAKVACQWAVEEACTEGTASDSVIFPIRAANCVVRHSP
jgi:hypothetical protein